MRSNEFDPGARYYVGVTARTDDHTFPRQTATKCEHRHRSAFAAVRCGLRRVALDYDLGRVTEGWAEPFPNPIGRTYHSAEAK